MAEMMLQIWSDFNLKLQALRPFVPQWRAAQCHACWREACRNVETV